MEKLKALCFQSFTMAWGYALVLVGSIGELLDYVSILLGDPEFTTQIKAFVPEGKMAAFSAFVGLITILLRARTLGRKRVSL